VFDRLNSALSFSPDCTVEKQAIVDHTRRWISSMVIGLNLCPFARSVFEADRIRYVASDARDEESLIQELSSELTNLANASDAGPETTLLIHPGVLASFLDYNEFLGDAEQLVEDLGLEGIVQIASFHPDYQFAGTSRLAVENFTNRSPYPMLHLLREESISKLDADPEDLLEIPRRNIDTLRRLGRDRILRQLKGIEDDPIP
jgi:uncharacterized protein